MENILNEAGMGNIWLTQTSSTNFLKINLKKGGYKISSDKHGMQKYSPQTNMQITASSKQTLCLKDI